MLYDHKRWDKTEVKTDPLTLEGLIAWLEKKPAAKAYDYEDCRGGCLYGLYMASHGIIWDKSGGTHQARGQSRAEYEKRSEFCALIYRDVAHQLPWTFGAALDRARKAASK